MNTLKSTIGIEKDDLNIGKYMVVISDSEGRLIGIPLRNVSKNTATIYMPSLGYAFEFGAAFLIEKMSRSLFELTENNGS